MRLVNSVYFPGVHSDAYCSEGRILEEMLKLQAENEGGGEGQR